MFPKISRAFQQGPLPLLPELEQRPLGGLTLLLLFSKIPTVSFRSLHIYSDSSNFFVK